MATTYNAEDWVKDSGATKVGRVIAAYDFVGGAEYDVQWQDCPHKP